ncbi:hypothetical protein EW146_g2828 [Bondarzewia mesenterica]|uniref:Uncharacterized protein n=1 Tax=Bondarzewia mesenterica TaxID=1095465 RepID=A0A4S4LZF3_9AGAM|nr:hypothetical protein EW146_g2828 [Bondarzewia mesenterica]
MQLTADPAELEHGEMMGVVGDVPVIGKWLTSVVNPARRSFRQVEGPSAEFVCSFDAGHWPHDYLSEEMCIVQIGEIHVPASNAVEKSVTDAQKRSAIMATCTCKRLEVVNASERMGAYYT